MPTPEMPKTPEERDAMLAAILDAMYIEDCHISGMHDPTHTPHYVCESQLRDLAVRVLAAAEVADISNRVAGEDDAAKAYRLSEINKIPRRIKRTGWYAYHAARDDEQNVRTRETLEAWERDGVAPRAGARA